MQQEVQGESRGPGKKNPLPILRQQNVIQTKSAYHNSSCNMKFRAEITTTEDVDLLYKSLVTEKAQTPRASLNIERHDNKLVVTVEAKDSTALRAMVNGVCKLLNVYEKSSDLK